jgi:hypothetical protein
MSELQHNIDKVRVEIMELESAAVFDQRAWAQVLIALTDRPNARSDAARRMATAKNNQSAPVAVETDYNADGSLKAYFVQVLDDDWGMFFHALSAGKAKRMFLQTFPFLDNPEWTDLRATRCRGADLLDITPFTDFTLRLAGYPIPKPGDAMYDEHIPNGFLDDCPCSMCRYERTKPAYQRLNVVVETGVMT